MRPWTTQDSEELYNIPSWGRGLFRVADSGNLIATPYGPDGGAIDLCALVRELDQRGIQAPVLLRFTDTLRQRIQALAGAFHEAIRSYGYRGRYRGVYPIKVNQQRRVVEDVVRFSAPFHLGLEAGSKPELLVVLTMLDDPEALIICNGYKDDEYIATALLAQKLGRHPVIVLEKFTELDTVLRAARRLKIRPHLGLRARLSKPGRGRWKTSSGDRSKFGLTAREMVLTVRALREAGYLDCLELLHFHIGSQVTAIRSFKEAIREGARLYTELVRMGAPMGLFDVGGGLGVDYDGSRTDFESSVNYSEQEYAAHVVSGIQDACDDAGTPHPDIVTESGRAAVAHHSVLVFNVLGTSSFPTEGRPAAVSADDPDPLQELHEVYQGLSRKNAQESWHDANAARDDALTRFNLGLLSLEDRARIEHLYWQVCGKVRAILRKEDYVPEEMLGLERALADTYYCNFSLFQSAPDSWAIKQLFPCLPLHRLDERPTRRAVLADITCDSDGKLDRFIDLRDVKDVLELHPLNGQPYYLGLFLVGAYQEILGDLHNLFGDTNAVHVSLKPGGGYTLDHVAEGDRVTDVLSYVQYSRKDLIRRVRAISERALEAGTITLSEARTLLRTYQHGLNGYTYLESTDQNPS